MPTEVIEGEVIEHALTVIPREALAATVTPEDTIILATRMATALSDVVERQSLYAVIQGKKYPQVEAWMTIGRMDNVVAREAGNPERHEDGSYEAVVELIRLSDGMVIGRGSALCGTKGDRPWDTRAEPARRSMAVTRATSRAFRQQYSWIMALAGYEPTPADEMPTEDNRPRTHTGHRDGNRPVGDYDEPPDRPELERRAEGLIGTVTVGKPPVDLQLRQTPDGGAFGFKLMAGRKGYQALAIGPLADALAVAQAVEDMTGVTVTVWGHIEMVPWDKDGKVMPPYARIAIERLQTPEWILPADLAPVEAPSIPLFDENDPQRQADFEEAWQATEAALSVP